MYQAIRILCYVSGKEAVCLWQLFARERKNATVWCLEGIDPTKANYPPAYKSDMATTGVYRG